MWILYQLALAIALLVAAPVLLLRRGRHYLPTLRGRLGLDPGQPAQPGGSAGAPPAGAPLWIHAVSVGEVGVAEALVRGLDQEPRDPLPLLITTVTPTGQARARRQFLGRASVAYLPFDLAFAIRRFLVRFEPRALLLVEGELWPLLLRILHRRGLPTVMVNGRISDRSFKRLLRLRPFAGALFGSADAFLMQSRQDAERLYSLGVEESRVRITGNLKYESPAPTRYAALETTLLKLAGSRPILIAGSTMRGEENVLFEAFDRLGRNNAVLVVAPRHPERFDDVFEQAAARGLVVVKRSQLDDLSWAEADEPAEVVVLDSLGELAGLYATAEVAFIGGTLVDTGGHNPLEPARFGVATVVGPSMHNFREMSETFDRHEAWIRVAGADGLAKAWRELLADDERRNRLGQNALALVDGNRGALAHTLEYLRSLAVLRA